MPVFSESPGQVCPPTTNILLLGSDMAKHNLRGIDSVLFSSHLFSLSLYTYTFELSFLFASRPPIATNRLLIVVQVDCMTGKSAANVHILSAAVDS